MMTGKEQELQQLLSQLKEENQLKTYFIYLLVHDFKGMFGSLNWMLNAFKNKVIPEETFLSMLPELRAGAQRNLNAIEDLNEWLKTQHEGFRAHENQINVLELFTTLKNRFSEQLTQKELAFCFSGDPNMIFPCDRILITFILSTFVSNAIKYSPVGGLINFETTTTANHISFSIEDFGIGMQTKTLEKIFTADSTLFKGTLGERGKGLGLKIAKDFAELLHGTIKIHSVEHSGTQAALFLPLS